MEPGSDESAGGDGKVVMAGGGSSSFPQLAWLAAAVAPQAANGGEARLVILADQEDAVAQQSLEQREGNADHLVVEVRMAGIAPSG